MAPLDDKVASYFQCLVGREPAFERVLGPKHNFENPNSEPANYNSFLAVVQGLQNRPASISAFRTELFRANVVGEDFSDLVPNDAAMVEQSKLEQIPKGAIIAFYSVPAELEEANHWIGPRKLQHLMISLGNGRAIGCENWRRIGIGSKTSKWEILELKDLNWFTTPRLDPINAAPIGQQSELPVRGRYRLLSEILNEQEQITGDDLISRLANKISPSTCKCEFQSNMQEIGGAKPDELVRFNLKCRIPENLYHHVFNGLNGVRGCFFHDAQQGENFVRKLLKELTGIEGLIDTIHDSSMCQSDNYQPITIKFEPQVLINAFTAGKIWAVETFMKIEFDTLLLGTSFERRPDCYPPLSQRWREDEEQFKKNWAAFYAEIGGNDQGHAAKSKSDNAKSTGQTPEMELKTKLKNAEVFVHGSGFWRPNSTGPNLDIKSSWINRNNPSANAGVVERKVYRSQQIKYFGFT